MHPDYTNFKILLLLLSQPLRHPHKKKMSKFNCVAYLFTGVWFHFQWSTSKRKLSPFLIPPLPGVISYGEFHISFLITILRVLVNGLLSRLFLFVWVGLGKRLCHRSHLCFSFSTVVCLQPSMPLQKEFPFRLWIFTWFLVISWITDIHMVSDFSNCHRLHYRLQVTTWPLSHRHQYGLWRQPCPLTSTWFRVAAQTIDIQNI